MNVTRLIADFLRALFQSLWQTPAGNPAENLNRAQIVDQLFQECGLRLIESDPKGNARPLTMAEIKILRETTLSLGPVWYAPFRSNPLNLWVDRNPGGGHYGNHWLRIGDPGKDPTALYRIFIHEGTHASNEYRQWMYEQEWCTKPGLDWKRLGEAWMHPRQQGTAMQAGNWETLPVDSRDVSVAPGEDLAEMVRYFVHSVKNERGFLWPLDQNKPPTMLWDTSPTRFVFVRDVFLRLSTDHPWYKTLAPDQEMRARVNLGLG